MENEIRIDKLKNGAFFVRKHMPFLRTVTLGIGVNVGSVNERAENSGISHLIEHTVFKRTKRFDGYQLKKEIEAVGGALNAFTSKEYTLFYARVPDFAAIKAFDVLYDLVSAPLFLGEDVEMEKKVVLEEIAMYEDDPVDLASTNLLKAMWGENDPYGRPIIGNADIVSKLQASDLKNYHSLHYVPNKMLLAAVGNIKQEESEYFAERMESLGKAEEKIDLVSFSPTRNEIKNVIVTKRDLKQVSVSMAVPTVKKSDVRSYSLAVMSTILGGGMSSVLFEEIREKRGLVYSISASNQSNKFGGYFSIEFSTLPKKVFDALNGIKRVLEDFPKKMHDYIEYGKKRLEGRLLTSSESTFSTMFMMVDDRFTLSKVRSLEEITNSLERVNEKELLKAFEELLCTKWTVSVVGPDGKYVKELQKYEFEVKRNVSS